MNCKHILIAFDGSDNALRAVKYTAEIAAGAPNVEIGIVYVERLPDRDRFPSRNAWTQACQEEQQRIQGQIEKAIETLEKTGLAKQFVQTHYVADCHSPFAQEPKCSPGVSIAQDILRIATEEHYGTVVIGRRGLTKAEEFLFGSVSTKIIHCAQDCSIWIVN